MAESNYPMSDRIDTIEQDVGELKTTVVQIAGILLDHSQRLEGIERSMEGMQRSMEGMQRSMDATRLSMEGRLDRLIAVTLEERTMNYERLREIERRLTKLEERAGQ